MSIRYLSSCLINVVLELTIREIPQICVTLKFRFLCDFILTPINLSVK